MKLRPWVAAVIWLLIAGGVAVAAKYYLYPDWKMKVVKSTGSTTQYAKGQVTIAADSFSGYAVLRSDVFKDRLKAEGIKVVVEDDNADYTARAKALKEGRVDMAVFTADSLIATGAALGDYPGTIMLVIDETSGADAIVGFENGVSKLEDLNNPATKIVLTRNSPSEFLARVVMSHFSVNVPEDRWLGVNGSTEVFKKMKASERSAKQAYVLWEPEVSKALELPGAKVILDSGKLQGFIFDFLVVQRKFLLDHPEIVRQVIEGYLRAAYSYAQQPDGMAQLVIEDAKKTGQTLTQEQAKHLVAGIKWKNTLENYAHFGLLTGQETKGLSNLEDVIGKVAKVLTQTGALSNNPVAGKESTLFCNKVLADLQNEKFHPGRTVNLLAGEPGLDTKDVEKVRGAGELPKLTDEQWSKLSLVGQMRVKPISFGRGKSNLTIQGQRDLDELAENLKAWPRYYLTVVGRANAQGDPQANMELAEKRAALAMEYLLSGGVNENRIRTRADKPSDEGAEAQSVMFILSQSPY